MNAPFGYETRAAFEGAEPTLRPRMVVLAGMLEKHWGFKLVAKLSPGTVLVELPFRLPPSGTTIAAPHCSYSWWTLCDNGGEISARPVNFEKTRVDPPYRQYGCLVPMGRLAYFCAMTMLDEEIDYGYTGVDDIELSDAA